MSEERDEAPIVKFVNAILVSSVKKNASELRVWHGEDGVPRVDFCIGGVWQEQIRPPAHLMPPIVRRLGIMACVPIYAKGQAARGQITLIIGSKPPVYFRVHIEGHGNALEAYVRRVKDHSSSGSGASSSG